MKLLQRFKQTAVHNQALVVIGVIATLGTLFYVGAAFWQVCLMKMNAKQSSEQTAKLIVQAERNAGAAEEFASAAKTQAERMTKLAEQATTQARATNALASQAKRSADIAEQTLKETIARAPKDQRPFVWPAEIVPLPIKVGEPIRVNVYFVNYGKTPAIKEKGMGEVMTFWEEKDVMKHADMFFAIMGGPSMMVGGSETIIPPGIPPYPEKSQAHVTIESVVGPTNDTGVKQINESDFSFAVVGRVTYFDLVGNYYWSDFCMLHVASGPLAWCGTHNEIH